jgi:dihydrofolate reductase
MRKLTLSINVSLDGFADHTVAVAADDELHDFFSGLLADTDIALLGRVTYQLMESYWPNAHQDPRASKSMLAFADKYSAVPKIVFSRTLQTAVWNNTSVFRGNMVREVIRLKREPGKSISLGGISVSQEFMRRGLINEYWLVVHPVVVGKGKRLFDGQNDRMNLTLVDTKVFKSGAVVLHYLCEGKESLDQDRDQPNASGRN